MTSKPWKPDFGWNIRWNVFPVVQLCSTQLCLHLCVSIFNSPSLLPFVPLLFFFRFSFSSLLFSLVMFFGGSPTADVVYYSIPMYSIVCIEVTKILSHLKWWLSRKCALYTHYISGKIGNSLEQRNWDYIGWYLTHHLRLGVSTCDPSLGKKKQDGSGMLRPLSFLHRSNQSQKRQLHGPSIPTRAAEFQPGNVLAEMCWNVLERRLTVLAGIAWNYHPKQQPGDNAWK